jgi:glycosyltransferase involved in cell wall biosynthesis
MSLTILSIGYPLAPVSEYTAGGAEQILAMLDEALVTGGHRSIVIAPESSVCSGTLIPTAFPKGRFDLDAKALVYREYRSVVQSALEQNSIDLIHMHGIDFLEYLPPAGVPVIVTLHLPLSWYPTGAFSLGRPNTHLVCVSESQKRNCPDSAGKCRVIPNGIHLDRYRPARQKEDYVVALGRICPEKGFHIAFDAASEAGIPLLLAGQVFAYDAHQEYFETMIRPRLTGRHRFLGAIGGRRKNELVAEARCLLVPSLVDETSSLVAMEALACGTPVVAFRRGALAEIVEDGCTGFLVETPAQMAQAILDAAQLSSSLCRERAERNLSATRMIDDYLSLYDSLTLSSKTEPCEKVA